MVVGGTDDRRHCRPRSKRDDVVAIHSMMPRRAAPTASPTSVYGTDRPFAALQRIPSAIFMTLVDLRAVDK
jgi:hypothetical protein